MRFQEFLNQAFAENFICLTQKLANPLKNLALHFLIGIPFLLKIEQTKSSTKRTRIEKYLPSCQLGLNSSVGSNIYYLSVLRPTFGVGAGEASINGIDNSSYSKGFFFISPFWNGAPSSPFPLLTRPFLKYYLRIS